MAYEEAHEEKRQRLEAAEVLRQNRTGLVLTGRIRNGELELDESTRDEIRSKFPDADVAFIALNSPFDAESELV
jgi:hypothetical protein